MSKKYILNPIIITLMLISFANAKSLYMASHNYQIKAYDIGADGFTLTYQYSGVPVACCPGGITLDGENAVPILFLTFEGRGYVQIMNANTMASLGTVTATGASNLAGIAYDQDNNRLYAVDRYTTFLYVYDWDYATKTLTAVAGSPFSLAGLNAYGIALDQTNNKLYIANATNTVNIFDLNADGAPFSIASAGTLTTTYTAISLAMDEGYQFLYYGAGFGGTTFLSQYNLGTNTQVHQNIASGEGVMGLDVDQTNHNVYITTGYGGDNLRVFDSALTLLSTLSAGVGSPTGLVIPRGNVSYNPLNLAKVSDVPTGNTRSDGQNITYTITYDNLSGASQVDNVSIVDQLPPEVDFVSATGGGTYNAGTREVTWTIGNLPAADPGGSLILVVIVNNIVPASGKIVNSATIDSDHTPPTTVTNEVNWSAQIPSTSVPISGYVMDNNNNPIEGVSVTFSNGGATVITDVNGYYITSVLSGWNGTSTATKSGWNFAPVSYTYPLVTTGLTDQNYTGSLIHFWAYISGHITDQYGNPLRNVRINYSNSGQNTVSNDVGFYEMYITIGWHGMATPSMNHYSFEPNNIMYAGIAGSNYNQDFVGRTNSFLITGYVRDIEGNGIGGASVKLSNGGATVPTMSDGFWETSVAYWWNGTATPTKEGYTFTPENISYAPVITNMYDQDFIGATGTAKFLGVNNNNSIIPVDFTVLPAYPNPFNPSTTIRYGLDTDSYVTLEIYDISGKLITTLQNENQTQGWYSVIWNGTNAHGEQVPAGIYLSKVASGNEIKTTKLMLLK